MTRRRSDRALLRQVLDDLRRVGCQFWACPGPPTPKRPPVLMATCHVCQTIADIRAQLRNPVTPRGYNGSGDSTTDVTPGT